MTDANELLQEGAGVADLICSDTDGPAFCPPDEPAGGPWTRHGHDVPGVTLPGAGRPPAMDCGGPQLCAPCTDDRAQLTPVARRSSSQ